ncbi:MAG: hypothetical protein IJ242_03370 [Clostridia bacterium]|nr:hypothetical protein [Clostridia bacterium]
MNSWTESLDFAIIGATTLLSVLGLWFSAVIPGIDRWSRRFFTSYFIVFLLCNLSGILEIAFQHNIVPSVVFCSLLNFEALLLSLPLLMVTVYLLHCCDENMRSSNLLHAALFLWTAFILVMVSSLFIDGIVYFTPDNQYYRGPLYPLLLTPLLAILLLNFAGTVPATGKALPQGLPQLHCRTSADDDRAVHSDVHRLFIARQHQLRPFRACHVPFHPVRSDRAEPAQSAGNRPTAAGNRSRARQHHGAANAAALHLQYPDEHLHPLQT